MKPLAIYELPAKPPRGSKLVASYSGGVLKWHKDTSPEQAARVLALLNDVLEGKNEPIRDRRTTGTDRR